MAKFFGKIGFFKTVETEPGIWEEEVTEHEYYGDLTRNTRQFESSGQVNDNINIANTLSIDDEGEG